MTIPSERTRAVLAMERAVMALAPYAARKHDRVIVPRAMLEALVHAMRHYPTSGDMVRCADEMPGMWGKP